MLLERLEAARPPLAQLCEPPRQLLGQAPGRVPAKIQPLRDEAGITLVERIVRGVVGRVGQVIQGPAAALHEAEQLDQRVALGEDLDLGRDADRLLERAQAAAQPVQLAALHVHFDGERWLQGRGLDDAVQRVRRDQPRLFVGGCALQPVDVGIVEIGVDAQRQLPFHAGHGGDLVAGAEPGGELLVDRLVFLHRVDEEMPRAGIQIHLAAQQEEAAFGRADVDEGIGLEAALVEQRHAGDHSRSQQLQFFVHAVSTALEIGSAIESALIQISVTGIRYSMRMSDRRRFLQALAALGVSQSLPVRAQQPRFVENPFKLGVASGYPRPDGMVLWTRLLANLDPVPIPVRWEIATDESMRRIVASGAGAALPEWAHSVHVEPRGLDADRWYWYRFIAGDAVSPVGRTRSAPEAGALSPRLRFAFASCQQYEQGWFTAYRHMAGDDLDLVAFVGDYIYEGSWGRDLVRSHGAPEVYSLGDYRARYALYKSDPDLQKTHRLFPWTFTCDDHEVDNDYANDVPEDGMPREHFLARRAAAYRAYYEHMPLSSGMRPNGPDMRIYTALQWGQLASFQIIDDRQYRAPQACPSTKPGSSTVPDPQACTPIADRSPS